MHRWQVFDAGWYLNTDKWIKAVSDKEYADKRLTIMGKGLLGFRVSFQ